MARLRILLPALRDRCGSGVLASHGEILCGPFRVLGTASGWMARRHGNPERDRLRPFGDPPTGGYVVTGLLRPGVPQRRFPRLGLAGAVVLEPTEGAAAAAARGGRERLLLHGGRLDKQGRLRRTRGGLRVADADLAALFEAIDRARDAGDPLSVVEVIDVAAGFEAEPALGPARRRRRRQRQREVATVGAVSVIAGLAMALFGVERGTPTRRRFLAQTLGAIAGAVVLDACGVTGGACPPTCAPGGGGGTGGSGSGTGGSCGGNRGSAGSGSGSATG